MNSDKFIFDQEILAQIVNLNFPHRRSSCAQPLLRTGLVGLLRRQHALRPIDPVAGCCATVCIAAGFCMGASSIVSSGVIATTRSPNRQATDLKIRLKLSRRNQILLDFFLVFLFAYSHPPLFKAKYLDKWASIESTFISDARFPPAALAAPPMAAAMVRGHPLRLRLSAHAALRNAAISNVTASGPSRPYNSIPLSSIASGLPACTVDSRRNASPLCRYSGRCRDRADVALAALSGKLP